MKTNKEVGIFVSSDGYLTLRVKKIEGLLLIMK